MDKIENLSGTPSETKEAETITYQVDKITFTVIPVYRDGTTKTIHDLLRDLMLKDRKTH